jgi:hypothetical protein
MNKFVLQLIETTRPIESSPQVQSLINDQTQSLLTLFLEKEKALSPNGGGATKAFSWEASQLTRVTKLIYDLVDSFYALDDSVLSELYWLTPMLSTCVESSNETVRKSVHKLQQKMAKVSAVEEQFEEQVQPEVTSES